MSVLDTNAVLRLMPLPVSGLGVVLRPLTGAEDQLLLEAPDENISLALALLNRLAQLVDNEISDTNAPSDWSHLTVTDLDILILRLRQMVFGNHVRADIPCGTAECGRRIDISFGINEYIAHYAPVPVRKSDSERSVEPAEESGWFRLLSGRSDKADIGEEPSSDPYLNPPVELDSYSEQNGEIFFRIPTAADQLAVASSSDPAEALAQRCIRPVNLAAWQLREVEDIMESMAPSLSNDLLGICPECGAEVNVYFDVRHYCLRELKEHATFVYEDIDTLARRYHWAEADILALPRNRRTIYAELARQEGDQ